MKIKEWIMKLQNIPGGSHRRVKTGIRNQMKEDNSFDAKWWDTVVTESKWKTMLEEALK